MDGIYINGARPKSKKQVKEACATAPDTVTVESTSMFSNQGRYPVTDVKGSVNFVGPDPYVKRSFYGTITRTSFGFKVT